MIKTILSIAGKPGLFKLVSRGHNMLIVESLTTGKRTPAYAHDKVISLGDIAIYTNGDDKPLGEVFELVKEKTGGQPVDVKAFGGDKEMREYFATILPDFDQDRVYNTDIKKLFQWYNQLLAAGITDFVEEEAETDGDEQSEEKTAE